MIWPFKRKSGPTASPEASAALAAGRADLAEVRLQREFATYLGGQLRETHRQNHFALAIKATMQGEEQ